jgi:hypothetical protein
MLVTTGMLHGWRTTSPQVLHAQLAAKLEPTAPAAAIIQGLAENFVMYLRLRCTYGNLVSGCTYAGHATLHVINWCNFLYQMQSHATH